MPLSRIQDVIAADDASRRQSVESLLAALTRRRINGTRLSSLLDRIDSRMSQETAARWPVGRVAGAKTINLWPVGPMTSATEQDEMNDAELEISLLDRASA